MADFTTVNLTPIPIEDKDIGRLAVNVDGFCFPIGVFDAYDINSEITRLRDALKDVLHERDYVRYEKFSYNNKGDINDEIDNMSYHLFYITGE